MTDSSENRRYSQAELETLFTEHDFDSKLQQCLPPQVICDEEYSAQNVLHKPFAKRRGYRHLDAATREEVAVIFHYTNFDRTQRRVINRLVIDGKPRDAKLL